MAARNKMPEPSPGFFQVLMNEDFAIKMRLPPAFVKENRGILTKSMRLRSGRKFWKVEVQHIVDGNCYFTGQGWTEFAKAMTLEILEFLVFWFMGNSTFAVSAYGSSACSKKIPKIDVNTKESRTVIKEENQDGAVGGGSAAGHYGRNPYFEIVVKEHHRSRLALQKEFVVAAGLARETSVRMEYEGGGHNVDRVIVACRQNRLTELVMGWREFRIANKLTVGETYSFEFIRGDSG